MAKGATKPTRSNLEKNTGLEKRIEELEKKVRDLENRPSYVPLPQPWNPAPFPQPIYPPQYPIILGSFKA